MRIFSRETAYLLLYFYSYSAAIGCLSVCVAARVLKGTRSLGRYCRWIVASVAFLLLRNVSFFLKEFRGMTGIEGSLAFYVLYMLTSSAFLGTLARVSLGYSFPGRKAITARASFAVTAIPFAFLPLLALLERGLPDYALRLLFINVVMYFTFLVVVAVIATLAARLREIPDAFDRSFSRVNVIASCSYVLLAFAQWFLTYRGQPYEIQPFCVVNVVFFLMFTSSAVSIRGKFLSRKESPGDFSGVANDRPESPGAIPAYPGCNEEESRIIALISRGATNREIADALGTNVPRVKNIVHRIFSRFAVMSRTELVRYFAAPVTRTPDPADRSFSGTGPRARPDF